MFIVALLIAISYAQTDCSREDALVILDGGNQIYEASPAVFGDWYEIMDATAVLTHPEEACDEVTNDMYGKIAVVMRGSCYFSTKSRRAQNAGAIAVIVLNNGGREIAELACGDFCDDVIIPTVFLSNDLSQELLRVLESDTEHTFQIWCHPLKDERVIDYDTCHSVDSVPGTPISIVNRWPTECPQNTAAVSIKTRVVNIFTSPSWMIVETTCCALLDKIIYPQNCYRIPQFGLLKGGGSSSITDQWDAQCGPDAIMVGIYDNDDEGDLDDIDGIKCCTLDCPHTCGKKIDSDDCVVVDVLPNSDFSCPIGYVLVGIYDDKTTSFKRVQKMKCCLLLQSILPTVSPTQLPTTDEPSELPTMTPTTSIPTMIPTTDEPSMCPSQNPTSDEPTSLPTVMPSTDDPTMSPSTEIPSAHPSKSPTWDQPTNTPTLSPSTEEPSRLPSRCPTFSDPTYNPSTSPSSEEPSVQPSQSPTTEKPTVSPTISPSTDQPTFYPSKFPTTDNPTKCPTTEDPTLVPSNSPSTDQPTFSPSKFPTTDNPTRYPTTEDPTLVPSTSPSTDQPTRTPSTSPTTEDPSFFPSMHPSTDIPTKFPTRNPSTEDPTALPSVSPTHAPTLCEPTCRSHTDQMVNLLERIMDFNSVLLEEVMETPGDALKNVLNEMILDLNRLKNQMDRHDEQTLKVMDARNDQTPH